VIEVSVRRTRAGAMETLAKAGGVPRCGTEDKEGFSRGE
jgi:hypothetical protein